MIKINWRKKSFIYFLFYTVLHKPATAATGGRVKKAGVCVKLWLAGIYFLVHAIFVASKLWIWQQFNFLAGRHLNYIFIDSLYHWLALMDYNPRISETRNSVNRFPIPSRAPVQCAPGTVKC